MALKNTHDLPPKGFQVFVPETGFQSRAHTGLEAVVDEIVKHRLGNPRFKWPTDKASVREWVLNSVEGRLRAMPNQGGMRWIAESSEPPPGGFTFPVRRRQPARGVVGRNAAESGSIVEQAKNIFAGIGLWLEWFAGSPVKQDLAIRRAEVCIKCPLNEIGGNIFQRFSEAAAKEIFSIFASLKHMKLSTPHDDQLGVCTACLCPMKAKIFSPLKIISKHLRPEARAALHPDCWIPKEESASETH